MRRKQSRKPKHIHHWLVERPSGETSKGECACGATSDFFNSHESFKSGRWNEIGFKRAQAANDKLVATDVGADRKVKVRKLSLR